jgi:hypothetical protein
MSVSRGDRKRPNGEGSIRFGGDPGWWYLGDRHE